MDPPGPFSRAERTLWTVWNYITEAVTRFLRPEETNIGNSNTNTGQESTADREPDSCTRAESDVSGGGQDEEQEALATAAVVNSSRAAVAWEACNINIDLGPDKEKMQYIIPSSRGSDSQVSAEGEGIRGEQVAQTGHEDTGVLIVEEVGAVEEAFDGKLYLCGSDGTRIQEHDEHDENTNSPNLTDVKSEDVGESGRKTGLEEEIDRAPDDQHKVGETMTNFQVEDKEEDDETLLEDEPADFKDPYVAGCLGGEEIGGKSPEEDGVYVEDVGMQKKEADAGVTYETPGGSAGVLPLVHLNSPASEDANSFKSNQGLVDAGAREVQEPLPVSEEMSDEDRDVKGHPGVTSSEVAQHVELQMAHNKSSMVSDDEVTNVGQEQMMVETTERAANNEDEDHEEMEDGSTVVGREQGFTTEEKVNNEGAVTDNEMLNKITEQEGDFEAVTEGSKEEEHIVIEHTGCSECITENAKIELGRTEFEDGDQNDDFQMEAKTSDEDAVKRTEVSGISEYIHHGSIIYEKEEETGINIPVDETFVGTGKDEIEQASYVERACTTSAVMVKPEGNNGGKISRELQNISLGICGGPVVMPQELDCVACEETQEGVPEYNNGHELDENTAQRFLEVEAYEDIQTTPLPEEAESFQNTGSSIEAGRLLVSEHLEEGQDSKLESTEHIENSFDMFLEGRTRILGFTDNELPQETEKPLVEPMGDTAAPALVFVVEAGRLDASLKTGVQRSEKVFGSDADVGSADETDRTEKEPDDDGTEEPLVELEWELSDSRDADAGHTVGVEDGPGIEMNVQNETMTAVIVEDVGGFSDETYSETEFQTMTEMRLSDESTEAMMSEKNSSGTTSLLEDLSECRLMKPSFETGPELHEDNNVELQAIAMEMQDARLDTEETGHVVEEEAAENESECKNDTEVLNLQIVEMAAELNKETDGEEKALTAGSESSKDTNTELPIEMLEPKHLLSDKALEANKEETMIDAQSSDESMEVESEPKDTVMIAGETEMANHTVGENVTHLGGDYTEGTGSLVIGHETDEEILDMWIETVLSEDADDREPGILIDTEEREPLEEPEPGPQTDMETHPSDEEPDEEQTEEEKEQSVASNAGDSGFLDQSLVERVAPQNGAQLLKLNDPESFQGIHFKTLDSVSEPAEISELSAKQPEAQNILMKETAEAGQSHIEEGQSIYAIPEQKVTETGFLGSPADSSVMLSEVRLNELSDQSQDKREPEKVESVEDETGLQEESDPEVTESETDWNEAEETTVKLLTEMNALFNVEQVEIADEPLEKIESNIPDEAKRADSGPSVITEETDSEPLGETSESEARSGEGIVPTESGLHGETRFESQDQLHEHLSLDRSEDIAASLPGFNTDKEAEPWDSLPPRTTSGDQIDASLLDFTAQKSRIAVKNPHVRPPKDPRTLLQMPSMEPTPSEHLPIKTIRGVPLGGLGMGIKLPGLPAGFPVLKKTQKVVRDETNTESSSQKSEAEPEVKDDPPKQQQAEQRPKWMPPRQPGFGNPLMSELKSKLKKTTKE